MRLVQLHPLNNNMWNMDRYSAYIFFLNIIIYWEHIAILILYNLSNWQGDIGLAYIQMGWFSVYVKSPSNLEFATNYCAQENRKKSAVGAQIC